MAKFNVMMKFEVEADSAEEAEELFWSIDDIEFMEAAQEAETIVEEAETA